MMEYDYGTVHERIFHWVDKDLLKFEGKRSFTEYTDLDEFILKSFGFRRKGSFSHAANRTTYFDAAIRDGELKIDWLFGPHGLTLYKALLIKRGLA
jgi:hypothetical protein